MNTRSALLSAAVERLKEAGCSSPALDARLLLCHTLGISREELVARPEHQVPQEEARCFTQALARREAREPMAHILERREFWGLDFKVTADTLDPRADSETLIDAACRLYKSGAPQRVLDLGTGTGCLLASLLSEFTSASGVGADISPAAAKVAEYNLRAHGLEGRGLIVLSDWDAEVEGHFDLIVSNPPYIPTAEIETLEPEVKEYEPRLALDGGADGLECYRRLIAICSRRLTAGGRVLFECGQGQAEALVEMLKAQGYGEVQNWNDLAGIARCVSAQRT